MPRSDDRELEPIADLAERILALCKTSQTSTVIAALATCLGTIIERGDKTHEPPAAAKFRYDLQQVVAQMLVERRREGAQNS